VSRWLASSFDDDGFTYGIDATLHVDGDTTRQRMVSNDVTATFDSLVSWFASNAGPSSPTPEALGLLLVASETTVDAAGGDQALRREPGAHGERQHRRRWCARLRKPTASGSSSEFLW